MRNGVMRRKIHRTLWKKLSVTDAAKAAKILSWMIYISVTVVFQCFCIVMTCEQRGRVAFGGEYLILPVAVLARIWIPEMIYGMSEILERTEEEEDV